MMADILALPDALDRARARAAADRRAALGKNDRVIEAADALAGTAGEAPAAAMLALCRWARAALVAVDLDAPDSASRFERIALLLGHVREATRLTVEIARAAGRADATSA
jgi:hypothetical protein